MRSLLASVLVAFMLTAAHASININADITAQAPVAVEYVDLDLDYTADFGDWYDTYSSWVDYVDNGEKYEYEATPLLGVCLEVEGLGEVCL